MPDPDPASISSREHHGHNHEHAHQNPDQFDRREKSLSLRRYEDFQHSLDTA
jgi:hypothetical protein